MTAIPVIALTGHLGAGKTTLLNHVLRTPDARIGVVINDFGDLNVDASLVTGQIDEPASIAGGCICCLPDEGGLDEALAKLANPRLRLDAIIVEASGLAEPIAVSRLIRFSGVDNIRHGGVVDVIDAAAHFDTVDRDATPPARYSAASLVVVNKMDQVPEDARADALARIEARVRERNPDAHVVAAVGARIDPNMLFDVAAQDPAPGEQLTFRELLADAGDHDHVHAASVTVTSTGCVDPDVLFDVLESPPAGVYRIKGTVAVRYRERVRSYVVNVVGLTVHIAEAQTEATHNSLVAIGTDLDIDDVRARMEEAVRPLDGPAPAAGIRRLQRHRRLSI
ncbi:CobW family GTP-binding protein [Mycolicibacterium confluentis]|uniref:Cobalamin biosynthesis protein n=1 Tax=Mycolicibacterium confluentis TaxID=28047 RepID=A0A7I7Y4A1_9MYCO|nr:GTP-binding protein [Mycolicibacterium confluentis]MCV7318243.1 GTP-binding protein [Mycolicibacterium confluentis]ORV29573.1 cobalamin biosynthesis protein CobW [Mycolicibacterium confluentis]BBZ36154.1 cobalamin biosynthesis protein [Mycolicibacterium confluentis]